MGCATSWIRERPTDPVAWRDALACRLGGRALLQLARPGHDRLIHLPHKALLTISYHLFADHLPIRCNSSHLFNKSLRANRHHQKWYVLQCWSMGWGRGWPTSAEPLTAKIGRAHV